MEYTSIIISSVIFFFSLSLLVMVWSKKPTKKHIQEMEEAGIEIAQQIQEATEESLKKIEEKINDLEEKYEQYEKKYQQLLVKEREKVKEKEITKVEKREMSETVLPTIDLKDEKAKQIYALYEKGYDIHRIAKEMDMYAGVVQVYMNLFKMNKAN